VTGVKVEGDRVVVQTNGTVGTFEVIELRNPPRVAIDIVGIEKAPSKAMPAGAGFTQVRFGRAEGKVRVVLDAADDVAGVQVRRAASGLSVRTAAAVAAATSPQAAPPAAAPAALGGLTACQPPREKIVPFVHEPPEDAREGSSTTPPRSHSTATPPDSSSPAPTDGR